MWIVAEVGSGGEDEFLRAVAYTTREEAEADFLARYGKWRGDPAGVLSFTLEHGGSGSFTTRAGSCYIARASAGGFED